MAKFRRTIPAPTPQTRPGAKRGVRGTKHKITPPIPRGEQGVDRRSKLRP